jgi:uncharacterized protein YcgL (UPF0745 family)
MEIYKTSKKKNEVLVQNNMVKVFSAIENVNWLLAVLQPPNNLMDKLSQTQSMNDPWN